MCLVCDLENNKDQTMHACRLQRRRCSSVADWGPAPPTTTPQIPHCWNAGLVPASASPEFHAGRRVKRIGFPRWKRLTQTNDTGIGSLPLQSIEPWTATVQAGALQRGFHGAATPVNCELRCRLAIASPGLATGQACRCRVPNQILADCVLKNRNIKHLP